MHARLLPIRRGASFAIGALVVAAAFAPDRVVAADAPSAQGFAVHAVRVFDGGRVIASTDVVVRDGRIAAIGPGLAGTGVPIAAGLPVVEGAGRTLLPGLIDAHTHSYGNARRDAIRFGVTTELDMFGDWRQIAAARATRVSLAPTPVADLWSAGTLATAPKGHGTEYGFPIPTLTKPEEADAFVAARFAEGSDYLKVILEDGSAYGHTIASLDAPTVKALIAAAHARQRLAVAHVATEADARIALDGGIDGLAHVFVDRPASPAFVAQARDAKVFVVATLSVAGSASGADTGRRLADDARLAPWLSTGQTDGLRSTFPATWQKPEFLPNATESVRRLHAAGIPILAGTDAGNPGTAHGASLHGELALLVAAGLSPTEALAAATSGPADRFHLGDRGRIAVGQRADLVLVEGDPTRDIESTRAIVAVWKNGAAVDRALLPTERPVAATSAAASTVVSDFDDGAIAVKYGQNWAVTTDALAGGKSTATQTWLSGGADGSKGAMHVAGRIAPELPYAWAGSLFMPGHEAFAAVDLSTRKTLRFKVRGDGRPLIAMIFSGPASNRQPSIVRVDATTAQWVEVRIALDRFEGADLARVRGFAITAGQPAGDFAFDLDDVRIE